MNVHCKVKKLFLGVALIYEAIYWKIKQTVNCIKNRMYYRNGLLYMPTVMPNELPEMIDTYNESSGVLS